MSLSQSTFRLGDPGVISRPLIPHWKRALDIAFSLAGLTLMAPLVLFITLITIIGSPGPVFFQQERVGLRGRRFMCLKFRTMKVGASTAVHQAHLAQLMSSDKPMTKMDAKGDSRLIPGGWILRATGLDELPQLINVLRGDMSLVGPRPCLPYEYDNYLPWQKERFNTLPGLTGLWQVSGKNRTTFNEMINLDIQYSRQLSPGMDLKIILMTVPALLMQVRDTVEGRKSSIAPQTTKVTTQVRRSTVKTVFSESARATKRVSVSS